MWKEHRRHLRALLDVMSRWSDFPQLLWSAMSTIAHTEDADFFARVEKEAINFYVSCFASHFCRLPVAPAFPPTRT